MALEEQNEEWNSHSLCGMTWKSGGLNERISYNEQTKISSQRRKRLISSYCKDIIAVDVSQISDYHFFFSLVMNTFIKQVLCSVVWTDLLFRLI